MEPHSQASSVESKFAKDRPLDILIAEDDETSRLLLTILLRGMGYEPTITHNGRECLDAVLGGAFDLLLTDIDMPVMNGIESAVRIRAAGFTLPIIAITASMPELNLERCLHIGINAFLTKPIAAMELKRLLREVCVRKWVDESDVIIATSRDLTFVTEPMA